MANNNSPLSTSEDDNQLSKSLQKESDVSWGSAHIDYQNLSIGSFSMPSVIEGDFSVGASPSYVVNQLISYESSLLPDPNELTGDFEGSTLLGDDDSFPTKTFTQPLTLPFAYDEVVPEGNVPECVTCQIPFQNSLDFQCLF
jgi:hypothetical protein